MKPAVFSIAQELATLVPGGDFRLLDHHLADGPVMAGVIRIDAGSVKGFWERHDGGDEILVILAGRATFTIRTGGEDMQLDVGPGDVLCVPRAMTHGAVLHLERPQCALAAQGRLGGPIWCPSPPWQSKLTCTSCQVT